MNRAYGSGFVHSGSAVQKIKEFPLPFNNLQKTSVPKERTHFVAPDFNPVKEGLHTKIGFRRNEPFNSL
jgi:hypothetical protein